MVPAQGEFKTSSTVMAMGHTENSFSESYFRQHLCGGIPAAVRKSKPAHELNAKAQRLGINIPKGLRHTAQRCTMKSGYAGLVTSKRSEDG
jgi:hypothetical protein